MFRPRALGAVLPLWFLASGCADAPEARFAAPGPAPPPSTATVAAPPPTASVAAAPTEAAAARTPELRDVVQIAAGVSHTCALRKDGAVACWGENGLGQAGALGKGSLLTRPVLVTGLPRATQIATGQMHSCAIDEHTGLWCWGSLGIADTRSTGSLEVKPGPGTGGIGMPLRITDATARTMVGFRAIALANHIDRACAIASDEVRCWRTRGILPDGNVQPTVVPAPGAIALAVGAGEQCAIVRTAERSDVVCWEEGGPSGKAKLPASASPVAITMGSMHFCVLDASHAVDCWRMGVSGVRPSWWLKAPMRIQGLPRGGAVSVSAGGDFVCTANADGSASCFLAEPEGLTDDVIARAFAAPRAVARSIPSVRGAIAVSSGGTRDVFGNGFACAIGEGGTVHCWGDNESAELGDGSTRRSPSGTTVLGP